MQALRQRFFKRAYKTVYFMRLWKDIPHENLQMAGKVQVLNLPAQFSLFFTCTGGQN
jgi:hypothetical protein